MKFSLLLFLISSFTVLGQYGYNFDPNDIDYSKIKIHFKGTSGKFMEFRYELMGRGMLNWQKNEFYENGYTVKVTYTDTLGNLKNPMELAYGNPVTKYIRAKNGVAREISFFDQNLKPINCRHGGFARAEFTYDHLKRVSKMNAYNQNGEFIVQIQYEYVGESEKKGEISYHDQAGNLLNLSTAKITFTYDKKGRELSRTFTNHNNELPEGEVKTIKIKKKNKTVKFMGNVSKSFKVYSFYDINGKLIDKMDLIEFSEEKEHQFVEMERFLDPRKWITD